MATAHGGDDNITAIVVTVEVALDGGARRRPVVAPRGRAASRIAAGREVVTPRVRAGLLLAVACAISCVVAEPTGSSSRESRAPLASRVPRFASTFDVATFQKGNLHTHTIRSDGDASPEQVIAWYRDHDYRFLALTDHNLRSEPMEYESLGNGGVRLIAGEEVSMTGAGRQVHVNALCTTRTIGGGTFSSRTAALAWALSEIEMQNGVALVNHPNFDHALSASALLATPGASLLEIKSGHPYVYSDGVDGLPSHEALWDSVLDAGSRVMGVAVDDTHHVLASGDPPAYPGVGWVEVFAESNDGEEICEALRRGRLIASTGMQVARIEVRSDSYAVWAKNAATVAFVGQRGEILRQAHVAGGERAAYVLRGDEEHVRARVTGKGGEAWTPSVFIVR